MIARAERREGSGRFAGMFSALAHRNFRWFFAGALLSNAGTWMQTVAQGWLVLELTDSPFWLGFDSFMATVPGLLLTLVGGVFADLVDRRRLLILAQVGAGVSALALAVLMVAGLIDRAGDVWIILFLSFVTGCCFAIAGPSYQAITFDLVGREDLANAIALNSTQFQLSRVLGPVLAGVTIKLFGLAGCFFANALSFVAIIFALRQVRFEEKPGGDGGSAGVEAQHAGGAKGLQAILRDLREGFSYAMKRGRVRLLLATTAVVSFFGSAYFALTPLFARDVYGWGETGLSLLMGTSGAGAFAGALFVAYLGDFRRKTAYTLGASLVAALSLVGFALVQRPAFALLFLFVVGGAMVNFFAVTNTLLQQIVQDNMRGRVLSMWILSFIGAIPLGNFLAGVAAERYGAPPTIAAGGLVIIAFVLVVGFVRARPLAGAKK